MEDEAHHKDLFCYQLKCDKCGRIIRSKTANPIRCTACGQGMLYTRRPKNYCDTCALPIFDNVSPPPVRATCASCTWNLVSEVRQVEARSGVRLDRGNNYKKRRSIKGRYRGSKKLFEEARELSELKTEGKSMGGQLAAIRKAAGLPQRLLAEELGVSPGHLCEIEHGRKPLTLEAFRWVKENAPKNSIEGNITP